MKNTLKVERAKRDMTQADLAEQVGVSRQTINAVEKGRYNPSVILALKSALVFEVAVDSLFKLEDSD
jgi:putative transcriptional regulator